jgi:putative hemolysin
MSTYLIGETALLLVLIGLNAFFAASEIAIISVRKARLRQMLDDKVPGAELVHNLAENSSRLLATIHLGGTLAGFFAAATSAETFARMLGDSLAGAGLPLLAGYARPIALVLVTSLIALLMLVFGELVPKNVALIHSERVALAVARPLSLIAAAFDPIVSLLSAITDVVVRRLGGRPGSAMPFVTEEEIKTMVDAGEETGVIEEEQKDMIYGVFGMGETSVREIMVPRVDMVMVDGETPPRVAASVVVQSGYSRLPVFEENQDQIVGVLHVKDLLAALTGPHPPENLRTLLRTPHFVPETKLVDDMLRDMQRMSILMAIVVDEYGGTAGMVTIEDLLEEIVGEIRDEHDREEMKIERIDEQTVVFSGLVSLDRVNNELALELSSEGVDSIGGFVAARLEKVPVRGDRLETPEAVIEVLIAAGRRAKRVKVTRLQPTEGSEPSEEA